MIRIFTKLYLYTLPRAQRPGKRSRKSEALQIFLIKIRILKKMPRDGYEGTDRTYGWHHNPGEIKMKVMGQEF